MNPLLRQLDRSLRDTSALYYSRLAEAQERKLVLWRNRYHAANASFEVNTLLAAMRCARYAAKAGTLRELQMRAAGGGNSVSGGGRWTDGSGSAMRHYDEAYRWIVELHRRAIAWRANALSAGGGGMGQGFALGSPAPITPGGKLGYSMDDIASPKFSESPGGGIGVELSLPGASGAPPAPSLSGGRTPPPPPGGPPPPVPLARRDSPALTSRRGHQSAENIAFFASLWEQCRAVASIVNAKLLRSTGNSAGGGNSSTGAELERQWSRHRIIFLSRPGVPGFVSFRDDDEFFGPAWHRFCYAAEELLTYACIAEGRWRRAVASRGVVVPRASGAPPSWASFHQAGAPWKAYGELCEAVLRLRKATKRRQLLGKGSDEWLASSFLSGRRKFVGSIASSQGGGLGTMGWRFENEARKDHRATALDYVLHALDLLDENDPAASPAQPDSSARLHYLASRLLMALDDPSGAMVHLNIASDQTKIWPSLHLSVQRALFACRERGAKTGTPRGQEAVGGLEASPSGVAVVSNAETSKDSCIELLMRSESCKLLSPQEKTDAQINAWKVDAIAGPNADAPAREIAWTHDDTCTSEPPFAFAVSFPKSTHATSSDTVVACVSIRSCLSFNVCVESMQLVTTSGTFEVPLERCTADEKVLKSWLREGSSSSLSKYVPNRGVCFESNDLAFFLTEIALPSNLSDVALGGASADTSKFIPKSGRLCNMGFSHAAGSICESLNSGTQQKIYIDSKPIPISSISEPMSSFLGGIPLVCHGVILHLKQADSGVSDSSSLRLRIERPRLVSPLLRSGTQRLIMEESNYTAHSWSRPAHHPWWLGPRVLRVLGPRPHLRVTNLTESVTDRKAVEGTVNRIMLKLEAGGDEDCWDVRVRLKCRSAKKPPTSQSPADDAGIEGECIEIEPHQLPIFVQKSAEPMARFVSENGVALPCGWEPRKDVGTDEAHNATTTISPLVRRGKSLLYPLDVYRPLRNSSTPLTSCDDSVCLTSYEVIVMYRQIRADKGSKRQSDEAGDQVMVMQSGSVEWISPFTAEFAQTNGTKNPFPCGIQHPSNMVPLQASSAEPQTPEVGAELIAAHGERVQMRCSLRAKGLGSVIAASVLRVTNENDTNELYSSDSCLFMSQKKQGSKLSLSYSVSARRDIERGKANEVIPLGVVSIYWKPVKLPLPEDTVVSKDIKDEFGSTHGPLGLPNLTPLIFYGPQCRVLPSPFLAKLLKCPSTPKVGVPFCITYQVTNKTAKSQTLTVSLNDVRKGDKTVRSPSPELLGTGKLKEEMTMAPFEEKAFSFTFMSMVAGKVLRPPLTVSSGRHQTWVINERLISQYLFVMP